MKKLIILLALFIGFASAQAQSMDTMNVQFSGLSKVTQTTFEITLSWQVIDTNDYYLLRMNPPIPPATLPEKETFVINYFNVNGQTILQAAEDSAYIFTKNKYTKP